MVKRNGEDAMICPLADLEEDALGASWLRAGP